MTPAERRVADLVAAGRTNREVAATHFRISNPSNETGHRREASERAGDSPPAGACPHEHWRLCARRRGTYAPQAAMGLRRPPRERGLEIWVTVVIVGIRPRTPRARRKMVRRGIGSADAHGRPRRGAPTCASNDAGAPNTSQPRAESDRTRTLDLRRDKPALRNRLASAISERTSSDRLRPATARQSVWSVWSNGGAYFDNVVGFSASGIFPLPVDERRTDLPTFPPWWQHPERNRLY